MMRLHNIADNEEGWIQVVKSMVKVIPMSDPLGPSVITLLLDDCPLPSRESVLRVAQMFNLSSASAIAGRTNSPRERNICVVLGCIAEKLAGPSSLGILNEGTLDYLLTNLVRIFVLLILCNVSLMAVFFFFFLIEYGHRSLRHLIFANRLGEICSDQRK